MYSARRGRRPWPPIEARPRIRALRRDDVHAQLERRLVMLGLGPERLAAGGPDPLLMRRLARALRAERRAARAASPGYDPLRHLVLARLGRLMQRGMFGRADGRPLAEDKATNEARIVDVVRQIYGAVPTAPASASFGPAGLTVSGNRSRRIGRRRTG